MKKLRLYIDTSILGGLFDAEEPNRVHKHMVNIAVKRLVNSTNLRMGYNIVEIVSPEEVIADGEVGA